MSGQSLTTFYFAYDDQPTNADRDFDDMIVSAGVQPAVPEPATWAMMLLGFGAMSWQLRRRRNLVLAQAVQKGGGGPGNFGPMAI